jgi:hypothetical protein
MISRRPIVDFAMPRACIQIPQTELNAFAAYSIGVTGTFLLRQRTPFAVLAAPRRKENNGFC